MSLLRPRHRLPVEPPQRLPAGHNHGGEELHALPLLDRAGGARVQNYEVRLQHHGVCGSLLGQQNTKNKPGLSGRVGKTSGLLMTE